MLQLADMMLNAYMYVTRKGNVKPVHPLSSTQVGLLVGWV